MALFALKMDKKDYTLITLSIALLVSLGFNAMPDATHFCESRELQAYCLELSSTAKTCYTLPGRTGGKRCTEGWEEIITIPDTIIQEPGIESRQWSCSPEGCTPIFNEAQ